MKSAHEDITPEIARKYLGQHSGNRNLNKNLVATYARDMAAGAWRMTHQGLAFTANGDLLDGQHRLEAVIRANVTVRMYVTRGVDPATFGVMDTGKQRSLADRFQIEGMQNSKQIAAIARRVTLWNMGSPWTTKISPTREEVTATLERHPSIMDAAHYAASWPSGRMLASSLAGFCWWLFGTISEDDRDDFMESLRTGQDLASGNPVLVLRERLLARSSGLRTGFTKPQVLVALTIIAWNHTRKHSSLTKLQLPSVLSDDTFPRPI